MYLSVHFEGEELEEHTINNAVNVTQSIAPTEIILDNASNISIIYLMLLEDL